MQVIQLFLIYSTQYYLNITQILLRASDFDSSVLTWIQTYASVFYLNLCMKWKDVYVHTPNSWFVEPPLEPDVLRTLCILHFAVC